MGLYMIHCWCNGNGRTIRSAADAYDPTRMYIRTYNQ